MSQLELHSVMEETNIPHSLIARKDGSLSSHCSVRHGTYASRPMSGSQAGRIDSARGKQEMRRHPSM